MGQFSKLLLAFDQGHIVPQRAMDCGPELGGLNQVMGPTIPLPRQVNGRHTGDLRINKYGQQDVDMGQQK